MYSPAIDSIAGDVLPLSCFKNCFINTFQGYKDSGWCLPAIKLIAAYTLFNFIDPGMCSPAIAFVILKISHVFTRYRSIAGKHITCVHPVSIDCGKTHKKSPAYTSVFRGFFAIFWQIFKTGCTISSHHHPVHYTKMFCIFMLFRPSFKTQKGERGGIEYDVLPSV